MHTRSMRTRFSPVWPPSPPLARSASLGVAAAATSKPDETTFRMFPQTSRLNCMKPSPGARTPEVSVNARAR